MASSGVPQLLPLETSSRSRVVMMRESKDMSWNAVVGGDTVSPLRCMDASSMWATVAVNVAE